MIKICLVAFAMTYSLNSFAQLDATVSIPRFGKVAEGIYRGARPGRAGLVELKRLGIKTIINLDNDSPEIVDEVREAKDLGIESALFPMHGWMTPQDVTVDAAIDAIVRSAEKPVYVHCEFGQDRTGVVVGLFRVFHQAWSPRRAFREMKAYGFSSLQIFMKEYFEDRSDSEL